MGDRTALVTGGSRGIGAGIARRLAADGFDVALTYLTGRDKAADVVADIEAAGRRALAIEADAADPRAVADAVETTVRTFGRIDVLVNNAGVFPYGPLEDVTLDEIDRTLAVHVRAVFVASQAAARHLPSGGRIISIGSNLADRTPDAGMTLYAMSKSALGGFTRGLARDLGPRGITVNLVQPGNTDTDMNPADAPGADDARAAMALGHFGTPDDVAAVVAMLAGPGGAQLTGTTITVDGGSNA
jgi:3-oxoacyl-[acyl-carrier protein] reductase